MTAPVAGIVEYLRVTAIGGMPRAVDESIRISPTHGGTMVELAPIDIGRPETGLPGLIKLDAFDHSVCGSLRGTMSPTSSETLTEQASSAPAAACHRAHVRLDAERTKASREPADAPLERGMTASTDMETCRRSTLQYLAKPEYKAFGGAVTEPCHAG